jgi:pimeloyl-ACP methyl ester carboxylesterase
MIAAPEVAASFAPRTTVVDGYEFHHVEAGTGSPLVFLHGAGGNRLSECHQLLAEQHRAIMIEQPGFEDRPEPTEILTDREYAAMVGRAARAIAGGPYHLVGTSFGTRVAAWIAVDSPDDVLSLALLVPSVLKLEGGPRRPPPPDPDLSPEQAERFLRQLAFARGLLSHDTAELATRLGSVAVPFAITFGSRDPIIPASMAPRYAELYPAATVSVTDDAGHAVYADQPAAVAADVLANIRRAGPR